MLFHEGMLSMREGVAHMLSRGFLLVSVAVGLVGIAGCAGPAPAPEAPPNPSPISAQQPPPSPAPPAPQLQPANYSARGRVRQLNYAEDGRVDGFLLDNGILIYLPANFSGTIPPMRTRVQVSGSLHPSVPERTVVTAQLVVQAGGSRLGSRAAIAPPLPPPANNAALPLPARTTGYPDVAPPPSPGGDFVLAPPPSPPYGAEPPPPPPVPGRPGPPLPPPPL